MIIYLDSSSVVKLYIEEEGSEAVRSLRDEIRNIFSTSRVTYVEVRSALSRRQREGWFAEQRDYRRALRDANRDWRQYFQRIAVSEAVVRWAGNLAERHGLKALDAIQLASALTVQQRAGAQVSLSTWDSNLRRAAAAEGLSFAHAEAAP